MALHQPPCNDINEHIGRVAGDTETSRVPFSIFVRVAVAEFDAEHAVPVIDPVDAEDRIHALLGYAPGELMELHGK